jgi:hypothetical protein
MPPKEPINALCRSFSQRRLRMGCLQSMAHRSGDCPVRHGSVLGGEVVAMSADPMAVFWSRRTDLAIAGKSPGDQLQILGDMIAEAEHAKAAGYGPPQSDIYNAKRKWNAIYEQWIGERLPSMKREIA